MKDKWVPIVLILWMVVMGGGSDLWMASNIDADEYARILQDGGGALPVVLYMLLKQ